METCLYLCFFYTELPRSSMHLIPSYSNYHPSPCSLSSYTLTDFGVYCECCAPNFWSYARFLKPGSIPVFKYRPGITRVPLTRTGYNVINRWMLFEWHQISFTRLDCYANSERSVKVWGWMTGQYFYDLTLILLRFFEMRSLTKKQLSRFSGTDCTWKRCLHCCAH